MAFFDRFKRQNKTNSKTDINIVPQAEESPVHLQETMIDQTPAQPRKNLTGVRNTQGADSSLVPLVGRIPFPAYRGNEPYIFISYAHADADTVFPIIKQFYDQGYHIWYDEGIAPGNEWTNEIADALEGAAVFLVFLTPDSEKSINVRDEINFAINDNKPFLGIHLKETDLTGGLKLRVGTKQAILKYNMSEEEFLYKYTFAFEHLGLPVPDAIKAYKERYSTVTGAAVAAAAAKAPAGKVAPVTIQSNKYKSLKPKGTAFITDVNGRTYTVPANSMFTKAGMGIAQGLKTQIDSHIERSMFTQIKKLIAEKYPDDNNNYHKIFHITYLDGNTYDVDIQTASSRLSFLNENEVTTINWCDVAEMTINWKKECMDRWPGFARVHLKNGDVVMMPDFTLIFATRKQPSANSMSWNQNYQWPEGIKTERGYEIRLSELNSISFGNTIRKKDSWSDEWISELPVGLSFRDGRQLGTFALVDWLLVLGQDEFGVIELKPEQIAHIDFVSDIAEEVYVPDAPPNSQPAEPETKRVPKNLKDKHPAGDFEPKGTAVIELKDGTVMTGIANSFVLKATRMEKRTMGNECLYTGLDTPDINNDYKLTNMMQFLEMKKIEYSKGKFKVTDCGGEIRWFTLPVETQFWFISAESQYEPSKIDADSIRSVTFDRGNTPEFPVKFCTVYCKEGSFRSPVCFISIKSGSPLGMKIAHDFSAFSGYPLRLKYLVRLNVTKPGADGNMFAPPKGIELTAELNTGDDVDFIMNGYFSIMVMSRFGHILNLSRSSFQGLEMDTENGERRT